MRLNKVFLMAISTVLLITGCASSSMPDYTQPGSTEEQAEPEKDRDTSKYKKPEAPEAASDTEDAEQALSDMEILTREGHPTYYGSVEQSHTVWAGIPKEIIHFADKTYGYDDNPVLSMHATRNSDLIDSVLINVHNFKTDPPLQHDAALELVASYLPYDIIDEYYEFASSRCIIPNEGKEGSTYYVVSYRLTEKAKEEYSDHKHAYSGSMDIIIQENGDTVESISIGFGTPRWMSSSGQNGYHEEEWGHNFDKK